MKIYLFVVLSALAGHMAVANPNMKDADPNLVYCDVTLTPMVYWDRADCNGMVGFVQRQMIPNKSRNNPLKVEALVYHHETGGRVSIPVAAIAAEMNIHFTDLKSLDALRDSNTRTQLREYAKKILGQSDGEIRFVGVGSKEVELRSGLSFTVSATLRQPLADFNCVYVDGVFASELKDFNIVNRSPVICVRNGIQEASRPATCVYPRSQPAPAALDCVRQDATHSPDLYLIAKPNPGAKSDCARAFEAKDLAACFQVVQRGQILDLRVP